MTDRATRHCKTPRFRLGRFQHRIWVCSCGRMWMTSLRWDGGGGDLGPHCHWRWIRVGKVKFRDD